MNWQSFISLIQYPSESTLFISNTRQDDSIGKTLSALLNTHGGILIIGYDKVNVHLTGYDESDEWINNFIDTHFNGTLSITSAFLFRSNKKILILEIIKSESPQPFKSKFYLLKDSKIEEFQPQPTQPFNYQVSEPLQSPPLSNPIKTTLNPKISIKPTIVEESNTQQMISQPETPPPPIQIRPTKDNEKLDKISNNESNLNHRQKNALKYVLDKGSIKNKQYRKLFSVSHKTAHIELAELVTKNELSISGSGRSTCYVKFNNNVNNQASNVNITSSNKDQLIHTFLASKTQITESMYADEFNIDLAQAINELKLFCDQGILEKTIIENEVFYIKANQLTFI